MKPIRNIKNCTRLEKQEAAEFDGLIDPLHRILLGDDPLLDWIDIKIYDYNAELKRAFITGMRVQKRINIQKSLNLLTL